MIKDSQCNYKFKKYDVGFEMSIPYSKYTFPFVPFSNVHQIVSSFKIDVDVDHNMFKVLKETKY